MIKNQISNNDGSDEYQYINLCKKIINNGAHKDDRTKVGTKSIFGTQMRFDLTNSFPLLTTKKVFWKAVVLELLWMVSGSTDSNILTKQGIRIWDGNSSREFLDSLGFNNREVGDLGPVYGFQWRHFGAKYINKDTDYTGKGVDQLQNIIDLIKTNPNDRRMVMSAWNPIDIGKMALPPCHAMCQFYVSNQELSCHLYQRSGDFGLGVPFNIASYSLLTHMIAHLCNLKLGDFVHSIGDSHVYLNHIEPLQKQFERKPYPFPTLSIKRQVHCIDDFRFEDFELTNYQHHPTIQMKMAV